MQIQKIKATVYAISERLQGNQLLRNPKGVPVTTVSTMRFVERIDPTTLDKSSSIIIKDNFSWLVENFLRNSKNLSFTKDSFISNRNIFVKQAIITYYRSNVNQYKQKPEDYLDNKEFRNKIDLIFLNYISEYKGV